MKKEINHPAHYGGGDNPYEAIKVIEAWGLGFCLGNAVKYICRAGEKATESEVSDLRKALWYVDRHLSKLPGGKDEPKRTRNQAGRGRRKAPRNA